MPVTFFEFKNEGHSVLINPAFFMKQPYADDLDAPDGQGPRVIETPLTYAFQTAAGHSVAFPKDSFDLPTLQNAFERIADEGRCLTTRRAASDVLLPNTGDLQTLPPVETFLLVSQIDHSTTDLITDPDDKTGYRYTVDASFAEMKRAILSNGCRIIDVGPSQKAEAACVLSAF